MCLIVFSYRLPPDYRLILAANRDEYYDRPALPLHFWQDRPDILAGVDLKGGGTWLGITASGRIAAITNFRDISSIRDDAPTRGNLVRDFLTGDTPPEIYLKAVQSVGERYNGFNLLVGDADSLYYYSNRGGEIQCLAPGIYGLSNDLLDTPWPKVQRAKRALRNVLSNPTVAYSERLFQILQDRCRPTDGDLPDTGIGLEWERILSPIFIASDVYGTRSSSVIVWGEDGTLEFSEKSCDEGAGLEGNEKSEITTFQMQIHRPFTL